MANNSIGAYAQGGSNDIGAYEYAASGAINETISFGITADKTLLVGKTYTDSITFTATLDTTQTNYLDGYRVKCIVTLRDGTPRTNLTSLKWAWFDSVDPNNFVAPVDSGTTEITDENAIIEVIIPHSSLVSGQEGCLALMTSDNVDMGLYRLMVRQ